MKTLINKYILLLVIAIGVFISSCEEDPNDWGVDGSYNRMFHPSTCTVDNVTATSAEVTFAKVNGVQLYIIEMSRDSLLFENIVYTLEVNTDTLETSGVTSYKLKLNNLFGNTPHSVRIKVTSLKDVPDSKYATVYFKTKAEQILSAVSATDKTSNSVKIKWVLNSQVTHILITPEGGTAQKIELDANDIAAGTKLISGLIAETNYTLEIYNTDANKRGTIIFKTYSNPPEADRVVWLTASDSLNIQAVMDTCTASSLTFVMPNGKYIYKNVGDAPFSIKSALKKVNFYALPGTDTTVLKIKSFTLPATVDMSAITFENFKILGYDPTADYCFNPSTSTGFVTDMAFKNCQVRNFRGVLRTRGSISVTNFKMTGCIVYNIRGYGLVIMDVNNSPLVDNIILDGCTFSFMETFIQSKYRNTSKVSMKNCTFYNMVLNGKYFVDYAGITFGPTVFEIENCIFSKMRFIDNAGVLTYGNGYRAAIAPAIINCYKTSDFVNQTPANEFLGLIDYGKVSNELYTNPDVLNFLIKDNTFAGKSTSGDPRWRPTE